MKSAVVSEGSAACAGAGAGGQSLGGMQLCLALLQGNAEGEHSCGRWGTPEQWLPTDPSVSHAPLGLEEQ